MPLPSTLTKTLIAAPAPIAQSPTETATTLEVIYKAQYQILSQWCWSAVGTAAATILKTAGQGTSSIFQCQNAGQYLPTSGGNCCGIIPISVNGKIKQAPTMFIPLMFGSTAGPIHWLGLTPCNQPGWPSNIVNGTGVSTSHWTPFAVGEPDAAQGSAMVADLRAGKVCAITIEWTNGGGHTELIWSVTRLDKLLVLKLADPWSGYRSVISYGGYGFPSGRMNGYYAFS